MPKGGAHLARNVLATERVRNTYLIDKIRLFGVAAFTLVSLSLGFVVERPGWGTLVWFLVPYCAASGALYFLARQRLDAPRFAALGIALFDMPIVFLLQMASLSTSPSPSGIAGFTLGLYTLLVVIASMGGEVGQLLVAAGVGCALEMCLQQAAGIQMDGMISACLVLGLTTAACRHSIQRLGDMAQRIDADIASRASIEAEKQSMRQRLAQSERLAALGTLAASVAHEINNPLAYMLANLDLMTEQLSIFEPGRDGIWQECGARIRSTMDQLDGLLKEAGGMPSEARHALRNVLTPVYVSLDAAAEQLARLSSALDGGREAVTSDLRNMLQRARDGGERLRLITRNLKSLSRSDDTALTPLHLRDVMESCVSMAEAEIRHHARLIRAYAEDVGPVDGNAVLLGQVLLNLLINAAQAIPDGHVDENTITVGTMREVNGWSSAYVRDTGPGMTPEVRARIFEPFFTTKPVGVGTGLGLSICRGIVESLHGRIDVESEPGRGSLFKISLPQSPGVVQAAQQEPAPAPVIRRRGRVMVIDDEVMIGDVLRQVLERDHTVSVFTSAEQALQRLQAGDDFDVILCDLTMPVMTAPAFYQALTRLDPGLADRVIFTTGGAFMASNQAFLRSIPNLCLEKPFDLGELRQVVQTHVKLET